MWSSADSTADPRRTEWQGPALTRSSPVVPLKGSFKGLYEGRLLGGSWVVISGVVSLLIWVITIVALLLTPLITTHEPPSRLPRSNLLPLFLSQQEAGYPDC